MKFAELEAKIKGRSEHVRIKGALFAKHVTPDSIAVRRKLSPYRGASLVDLGIFHRNGRLDMVFGVANRNVLWTRSHQSFLRKIIPETWSIVLIAQAARYFWHKKQFHSESVLIPYEPGDYFDVDAGHLFAQNRSNL